MSEFTINITKNCIYILHILYIIYNMQNYKILLKFTKYMIETCINISKN